MARTQGNIIGAICIWFLIIGGCGFGLLIDTSDPHNEIFVAGMILFIVGLLPCIIATSCYAGPYFNLWIKTLSKIMDMKKTIKARNSDLSSREESV